MVKVGSMRRVKRILLIASVLVLSAGGASASWWKHRSAAKPAPQPAEAAATAMTLNAIELGSPSQIILRTSAAPVFTSLSPVPDQFVVDLSGTTKATALVMPSPLPAIVSAITADEVTEMGSKLTRVTLRLAGNGSVQASAEGNSIVITLPAAAVAETPTPKIVAAPVAETPKMTSIEPAVKSEPGPLNKATVPKQIETS